MKSQIQCLVPQFKEQYLICRKELFEDRNFKSFECSVLVRAVKVAGSSVTGEVVDLSS